MDVKDALFEQERFAEAHVAALLSDPKQPINEMLLALDTYRKVGQACIFADFENAAAHEDRIWLKHTEARKYLHRVLSNLRRLPNPSAMVVEKRGLVKLFVVFLKASHRFYQNYIQTLRAAFPNIPELDLVVRGLKIADSGESPQQPFSPQLRAQALSSCHHALVYIGDLARYRAAEKLDDNPSYARAVGYYDLACAFRPSSGLGHHQQAVIALEQRRHLHAIYHLYRGDVVAEPHPNAAKNLKLEFEKVNSAWEKGQLIQKGRPNDPDMPKNALIGWFVRLHAICYKGEVYRGYEELEREVLGQLAKLIMLEHIDLDTLLRRMVMVNMAAQFTASENFQKHQTPDYQQSFFYFFRFNIKTFTTLLRVFEDGMARDTGMDIDDSNLASKLTPTINRVLPSLRLYSAWLLPMIYLLDGLSGDEFPGAAVHEFWPTYTRTVDMISQTFPIWDFDDLPQVNYLLEEEAESLAFKPLMDEKTMGIWYNKHNGVQKPYPSDPAIVRVGTEDEMLARVIGLLNDAVSLANDEELAPLKLHSTRFLYGDEQLHEPQSMMMYTPSKPVQQVQQVAKAAPAVKSKPLSYAAAAVAPLASKAPVARPSPPVKRNGKSGAPSAHARQEQMSRMVDTLLEDDDGNRPITPPQPHADHPGVEWNDLPHNTLRDSAQDMTSTYPYQMKQMSGPSGMTSPPDIPTPKSATNVNASAEHLQHFPNPWLTSPLLSTPSQFPPGLPTGTLSSTAHAAVRGHSRVNSVNSIRSRGSQTVGDSWSSLEPGGVPHIPGLGVGYATFDQSKLDSPVLFGTGGGPWSSWNITNTSSRDVFNNVNPPDGQGG